MMTTILLFIALLLAGIITYQDFTSRWVSVFALIGVGIIGSIFTFSDEADRDGRDIIANIIFISLIFFLLKVYFRLRGKTVITDELLGKGDIVLLYSFCFWFSFQMFLYFYIICMVFSLLSFIIYCFVRQKNILQQTIPLAGLSCIPFQIYLIYLFIYEK